MRDTEFFFWILVLPCSGTGIDAAFADFVLVQLVADLCFLELASKCNFEPF